ncbi:unnamed protein product [Closterium sp. NIES-54]
MSQSLELNQRHHVMHLLPEVDCEGVVRVALERGRASATCFGQNARPLCEVGNRGNYLPGADQVLEDVIAAAGIVASIHERIEPAAEPELVDARVGADEDSGGLPSPPTEGWRQRQQRLRDVREPTWQRTWLRWCWTRCKEGRRLQRPTRRYRMGSRCEIWTWGQVGCWWQNERELLDGGARRNQKNGANMVADSSDNNPKSNGSAEKKKECTGGQFFHIGEQEEQGDASAKVGAELHPLDYWVLDTGAAWTMTPRKELLDDVRAAPINEVCSASGHALKVAGAGRAAFKGADGKPVVLHDVLLVPDLKSNLISLRKLAKAGVSTSTDGARTYKGQLGNRVLWDLHESKDVYRSMWQLPALAWHGGGQAGEGSASQGECNAVGGVGVKVSARSGETDWATAHRRLGHVAMPLLKQLEKDGGVKGLKLNGQPCEDNCEICLLSKFTRFPVHSVTGRSKKHFELVHMDLVGPLPVQGHKGERYFLTIVDDWSRLMWAYPLKQKDHAASTIKEDWLPFVEKQSECVVKRIRTDRGGEFLGAEMTAWLKKQGIQRALLI